MMSKQPHSSLKPQANLGPAFEHLELAADSSLPSLSPQDREKLKGLINATRQELVARGNLIVSQGDLIADLNVEIQSALHNAEASQRERGSKG